MVQLKFKDNLLIYIDGYFRYVTQFKPGDLKLSALHLHRSHHKPLLQLPLSTHQRPPASSDPPPQSHVSLSSSDQNAFEAYLSLSKVNNALQVPDPDLGVYTSFIQDYALKKNRDLSAYDRWLKSGKYIGSMTSNLTATAASQSRRGMAPKMAKVS